MVAIIRYVQHAPSFSQCDSIVFRYSQTRHIDPAPRCTYTKKIAILIKKRLHYSMSRGKLEARFERSSVIVALRIHVIKDLCNCSGWFHIAESHSSQVWFVSAQMPARRNIMFYCHFLLLLSFDLKNTIIYLYLLPCAE